MTRRIFWSGSALFWLLLAAYLFSLEKGYFFVYWWWDIPMHVIGGVLAGLIGAWCALALGHPHPFRAAILGALVLGIGVEIAEYAFGFTYSPWMSYSVDTAKDLVDDLIGACLIGSMLARYVR